LRSQIQEYLKGPKTKLPRVATGKSVAGGSGSLCLSRLEVDASRCKIDRCRKGSHNLRVENDEKQFESLRQRVTGRNLPGKNLIIADISIYGKRFGCPRPCRLYSSVNLCICLLVTHQELLNVGNMRLNEQSNGKEKDGGKYHFHNTRGK
jgi:hypothetical protein